MFPATDFFLARALEGPADEAAMAMARLAELDPDGRRAERAKLAAALALAARRLDVGDHPVRGAWRSALHAQAARNFLLDDAAERVGQALGEAGIDFAPIKGFDLAGRVYAEREERRMADLDVLVAEEALAPARAALQAAGFRGLRDDARAEDYLRREGYAWPAWSPRGILVELHFRLWGTAPAALAPAVLRAAPIDPALGPTARRLRLEHAFLLAAFHGWLDPPPRPLAFLRDLRRICVAATVADDTFAEKVVDQAVALEVALPTALAATLMAELFAEPLGTSIADGLRPHLRGAERGIQADPALSLRRLTLARLRARRPTRHGWRVVARALWPHPAVVDGLTPESWPWPLRRLWYLCHLPPRSKPQGPCR
jgi:hypothetical protein